MITSRTPKSRFSMRPIQRLPKRDAEPAAIADVTAAVHIITPSEDRPQPTLHVLEHPLALQSMGFLRDVTTPKSVFRTTCSRVLEMLILEATRQLPLVDVAINTAHGSFEAKKLSRAPVFLSISNHGLGVTKDVGALIPDVLIGNLNCHVTSKTGDHEIRLHLPNTPSLKGAHVYLFEPVLALSGTTLAAINFIRGYDVRAISLLSFVAARPTLDRIQADALDTNVYLAAVDERCDAKGAPLPGLGDFGSNYYR